VRELADAARIRRFLRALGAAAESDVAAYLTGGATAVLLGWRESTIDVDVTFVPETDAVLRALARLKDELEVNVELVSPAHFIPLPPRSEERAIFVVREGRISFYHFDPYAQALAKVERGHRQDLEDVHAMVERGLVEPERALALFAQIEPELFRFPALDPRSFARKVERAFVQRTA